MHSLPVRGEDISPARPIELRRRHLWSLSEAIDHAANQEDAARAGLDSVAIAWHRLHLDLSRFVPVAEQ